MNSVIRATVIAVAAMLMPCVAFAQEDDAQQRRFEIISRNANQADSYVLDISVPEAPAFALLGLDSSAAQTPRDQRDFAVSLANFFDADGGLNTGVGITTRPYWWGAPAMTLQEYRDRSWLERTLLGQLRLSAATAPGAGEETGARLGVGATVQLLSRQDPRLSDTLLHCLETQADVRGHIVDQATREHVYPPLYTRIRAEIAASYPPLAANATVEQQRAREEAIDTIAEDQANRQLGSARNEFLYGDAEYQRYLTSLETCRSNWEDEKALAPSWLFSVGQAFQANENDSSDFEAEGASVWTSYNQPFRLGTDTTQNNTRASAQLYARYSQDQEVPIGDDTFAADVGVAALSLRRERDDRWSMAVTVSHHTQDFSDAAQEDREFTQYGVSASWKPEGQRFWVQGFYGGRGNEDEEVATLALVFDWGSSNEQ
jgi:hypothetical protein